MVNFIFLLRPAAGQLCDLLLNSAYAEGVKLKLFITTETLLPLEGASPLSNQRFMFAMTPAAFELAGLLNE